MPKRKREEEEGSDPESSIKGESNTNSETTSESVVNCLDTQRGAPKGLKGESREESESGEPPRKKKRVIFDGVTVYYFHRSQGFTCVPSCGGTTLGMIRKHHKIKRLSVTEHEIELANQREKASLAMQLSQKEQQEIWAGNSDTPVDNRDIISQENPDNTSNSSLSGESTVTSEGNNPSVYSESVLDGDTGSSCVGVDRTNSGHITEDDEDDEEEEEEKVEEEEVTAEEWNGQDDSDDNFYLQPLGTKERRALLKLSGVNVEGQEKQECQMIRSSRQTCGCDCQGECRPKTCACAKNQIKCQVDRPSFPCGCTKNGCGNPAGRVEFNPVRVRTHYIHTMMKLKMEQRCGESSNRGVPSPSHIRFDGEDSYCDVNSSHEESAGKGTSEDVPGIANMSGGIYQAPIPSFHTFFYNNGKTGSGVISSRSYQNDQQSPNTAGYWHLDAAASAYPSQQNLGQSPAQSAYVSDSCYPGQLQVPANCASATTQYPMANYPPSNGNGYPQSTYIQQQHNPQENGVIGKNFNNSVDSGFVDNFSPASLAAESPTCDGTYSLSSLYQHHSQKRPVNTVINSKTQFSGAVSNGSYCATTTGENFTEMGSGYTVNSSNGHSLGSYVPCDESSSSTDSYGAAQDTDYDRTTDNCGVSPASELGSTLKKSICGAT